MGLRDPRKQEVIYGVVYDMSPSPNRRHALVDGNIFGRLKNSFKDSRCEIFMEQLDFYFHYQEDKSDYIIPDIAIVCDWGKDEKRYHGTPRFVVETLSPSTGHRDKTVKKEIYQKCGVEVLACGSKRVHAGDLLSEKRQLCVGTELYVR